MDTLGERNSLPDKKSIRADESDDRSWHSRDIRVRLMRVNGLLLAVDNFSRQISREMLR